VLKATVQGESIQIFGTSQQTSRNFEATLCLINLQSYPDVPIHSATVQLRGKKQIDKAALSTSGIHHFDFRSERVVALQTNSDRIGVFVSAFNDGYKFIVKQGLSSAEHKCKGRGPREGRVAVTDISKT